MKKGLTNDNKKKINKIYTEFTNKQKAYKGPLQSTEGAYIAEVFGGSEKAIQEYSALLQKASEQFTITGSDKKLLDVRVPYLQSGNRGFHHGAYNPKE